MITLSLSDLEGMFDRVIASQQPFFQGMLTTMSGMDSRMAEMSKQLHANTNAVELMKAAEFDRKIGELNKRIESLEDVNLKRSGVVEAFEWAPKALGYLALIVGAIWGYFNLKAQIKP